jgi:hypothetical protein
MEKRVVPMERTEIHFVTKFVGVALPLEAFSGG